MIRSYKCKDCGAMFSYDAPNSSSHRTLCDACRERHIKLPRRERIPGAARGLNVARKTKKPEVDINAYLRQTRLYGLKPYDYGKLTVKLGG